MADQIDELLLKSQDSLETAAISSILDSDKRNHDSLLSNTSLECTQMDSHRVIFYENGTFVLGSPNADDYSDAAKKKSDSNTFSAPSLATIEPALAVRGEEESWRTHESIAGLVIENEELRVLVARLQGENKDLAKRMLEMAFRREDDLENETGEETWGYSSKAATLRPYARPESSFGGIDQDGLDARVKEGSCDEMKETRWFGETHEVVKDDAAPATPPVSSGQAWVETPARTRVPAAKYLED